VEANDVLPEVEWVWILEERVVGLRHVGEAHRLLGHRRVDGGERAAVDRDPVRRNDVALERLARLRIAKNRADGAEVARLFRARGQRAQGRRRVAANPLPFLAAKEEQFALHRRTAEAPAKVVIAQSRLGGAGLLVEERIRVERVVAAVLEAAAV